MLIQGDLVLKGHLFKILEDCTDNVKFGILNLIITKYKEHNLTLLDELRKINMLNCIYFPKYDIELEGDVLTILLLFANNSARKLEIQIIHNDEEQN